MSIELTSDLLRRVAVHSALADPARLAVVDALALGDKSPSEIRALLGMPSNLLAHHLGVLEGAGIITRSRSEGDRRRSYLHLLPDALNILGPAATRDATRVVFVCSQNSARSQLAAALWTRHSPVPATSAGTHPAARVHPGAVKAARRHHLPFHPHTPRHLTDVLHPDDFVIAVCDRVHEELDTAPTRMHWSVADPVPAGDDAAFDHAVADLTGRITRLAPAVHDSTIQENRP